jgi:hypothetical protein
MSTRPIRSRVPRPPTPPLPVVRTAVWSFEGPLQLEPDRTHSLIVHHLLQAALLQEAQALDPDAQLYAEAFDPQTPSSPPLRPRTQTSVRLVLGPCRAQKACEKPLRCSICLESNPRMFVRTLPCCGQTLHSACVDRWFRSGQSHCPLCRHQCFECEEAEGGQTEPAGRSATT